MQNQSFFVENLFIGEEKTSSISWRIAGNLMNALRGKFERMKNERKHYRTLSERRFRRSIDEAKRLRINISLGEDTLELIQRRYPVMAVASVCGLSGFVAGIAICAQNYVMGRGIPASAGQLMVAVLLIGLFGLVFGVLAGIIAFSGSVDLEKYLNNRLPELKKSWYRNEQRKEFLAQKVREAAIDRLNQIHN